VENPFSWDYLTAPLRETPDFGVLSTAFFVLFVVTFVGSIVTYVGAGKRRDINPVLRRAVRNGSQIMMWITATGLFFYSFRLMRVAFLNLYMRIWIYLVFLIFVAAIVYFVYYMRKVYPEKLAAYHKRLERRRYTSTAERKARTHGRKSRARRSTVKTR
jgi:magnesium-transporting ATPase (P-type)